MRWLFFLIILMFGCKQENDQAYYMKAVVRNAGCSNSLFETKCESNVMLIDEPLIGEHCSPMGLAGAVGDTITMKLVVVDSMTVRCLLPWR